MRAGRTLLVMSIAAAPPLLLGATHYITPQTGIIIGAVTALACWLVIAAADNQSRNRAPQSARRRTPGADPAREALEQIPQPVLLVGRAERVLFANKAAQTLYRTYEPKMMLSALVRHPEVLATARRAASNGCPARARLVLRRAEAFHVKFSALPLAGGHLALVFEDETALHKAEHLRAGFLANASHELRTPLASLQGYIDTLRGHARDDPQAREKFLDIMAGQAGRMGRLIDDLLSLSRIEMDEHIIPKTLLDLRVVLGDVCDALTPIAKAGKVSLVQDVPDQPVLVAGTRDQLLQMVQNLIDNAIKYSRAGAQVRIKIVDDVTPHDISSHGPFLEKQDSGNEALRLHIVEAASLPEQGLAVLQVQDSGPGIAKEHLPRLGGRFYRVERGKSGTRTGTGLGLAIVKHIIARHRGTLIVQSAPGLGSTFMVALPKKSFPADRQNGQS